MAHTRIRHRTCEVKQPLRHLVRDDHAARLHNAGGIRVGAHGLAPTRFTGLCRALSPPRKRNLVAVVLKTKLREALEERTEAALKAIRQFILMTPPSAPPTPPPLSPLPHSPPASPAPTTS